MDRRQFFRTSAATIAAGSIASDGSDVIAAVPVSETSKTAAPAILRDYTATEHRKRLLNVGFCERSIRTCLRKHLITSYLPGQCRYILTPKTFTALVSRAESPGALVLGSREPSYDQSQEGIEA